ncbi:MAG TPA: hypothetical protein VJ890_01340 [Vineibacter sp.]|nr:hypothetical protein [Vineibacter sp.]
MSVSRIKFVALFLAASCGLAGLSAAGPAQAYNPKELTFDKSTPWFASPTRPRSGVIDYREGGVNNSTYKFHGGTSRATRSPVGRPGRTR